MSRPARMGAATGIPVTLATLAARNPRSTPIGDALGTVAGSVIDWASRPAFMVADAIQGDAASFGKNALNFFVPGTQAIEPIAGSRETVSRALEEKGVNFGGGLTGFAGRFAVDVITDPLTYLTFGTASGLKGGAAIGKATMDAVARSGAKSPRIIAQYEKAGLLTPEAARVERIRFATRAGAERQNATKQFIEDRGGQGVVAGLRVPTTIARGVNAVAGTKIKTVYPFAESKTLAKGLNKVGVGLNGTRSVPALRSIFEAAGGEDRGAYEAMKDALNVVNYHKAEFARDSRNIEKAIEKTGRAAGIKRVDASPIVSHLYDATEVAARGREMRAELGAQLEKAADDAERAALMDQIAQLPTDTRSAYEWLRANHNHGSRFQFADYDTAVRAFGNPDDIADDSILGIVRRQAQRYEDYADSAGVLYTKLDQPYLTHLPANKEAREALNKLDDLVAARKGERRKMQEGFTRHRALPTLMDWYLAEQKLGVKMVPELSVGNRLTVRGVSGASEAMHSVLMREFVKMYGARGPLPDMDELEDALRDALREAEDKSVALDKLLNRSTSKMTKQAQSDYSRLRQERIAAKKALSEAEKAARLDSATVMEAEAVKAAKKRLDDIEKQIEDVKNRPRLKASPVDLDAARQEKIAEATRNLEIAQADRAVAVRDMAARIKDAALEKIRDVKSRFTATEDAKSIFDSPEAEAQALRNEQVNQARQEVRRLEGLVKPVVHEVARYLRASTQAKNAAAREARKGMGAIAPQLGKAQKQLAREINKPNPNQERIDELQERIATLEMQQRANQELGVRDVSINDRLWAGRDKKQVEDIQVAGQNAASSGRKKKKDTRVEGGDKPKIADWYDDAMEEILRLDEVPSDLKDVIDQADWADAAQQITELDAAMRVLDEFEADNFSIDAYNAQAEAQIDEVFGAAPDAAAPAAPAPTAYEPVDQARIPLPQGEDILGKQITGTNAPEGDVIPTTGQPSDIIPQTPIDSLPWSQRQVIKLMRKRFGTPADLERPWMRVTPGERGFSIRVGNRAVTINMDDLRQMELDGWVAADVPKSNGQITRIKPGPKLQAEGRAMSEVEGAISENLGKLLSEAGDQPVRAAQDALNRASQPVTKQQQRIARLEAELATAIEQGKANVIAERELGELRQLKKDAREQLKEAKRTAREDAIASAKKLYDDLRASEKALREFIRMLKTPPPATKVAAATRRRDSAVRAAQKEQNKVEKMQVVTDAAKEYVRSLYRADASYDEAKMVTGYVRDQDEWDEIYDKWVSTLTDPYFPKNTVADPNAGVVFDPAVAPQIKRAIDRISPVVKDQHAMRKAGNFIRGITRAWKGLVLATPGYHIRNMIDDGLRAYWAGARNPTSYFQAVRILQGKASTIKIRGEVYTREEILSMANAHGLIGTGSQYHSEVGPAYERMGGRKRIAGIPLPRKPGSGVIVNSSQMIGEMRENMTRLGTFLELMKNGEDELTAAKNVRDFLFDYNDVSQFIIMAKDFWMPFVTYTMKAVPFYAKTAVQRPGQIANLGMFMRDMTAAAAQDYAPGEVTLEYMAPGQELSFVLPKIPGVSDALFGEGKPGAIDPSNLIGISALNSLSPITFPQPTDGESAVGAALGTIPRGVARVAGGMANPLFRYGVELGTQQDLRFGSPLPNRTRLTPVPLAAQRLLSAVSGGTMNLPGYGMKTDAYSGEQVEGASTNLLRLINLFPPITQGGSYATVTGGFGFDNPFVNESDAGRISFVRTFSGIPVRPLDVSRAQFYATRRQ